jgi:capsule polysaccharide export protein KpsE/RkpR
MGEQDTGRATSGDADDEGGLTLGNVVDLMRDHLSLLILGPLVAGLVALGITFLIPPTFTASTTFMPPQQAQSTAASALASLGSLASLAGGAAGNIRTPGEQYVALMQSIKVSDHIIERFKLMDVYEERFRVDARRELAKNVRIAFGKKDGFIGVEVDDHSPQRAAEMANAYVDELRRMTALLAVSEAQQRRVFFGEQLQLTRDRLTQAQQSLLNSGFNPGALNTEPKAAAEGYAKLRADVTIAEVKLQTLRGSLTDSAPEVRQATATLAALKDQLARSQLATQSAGGPDYVGRYREFKYQETLFELYARQFELARADEAREGTLIQVVDAATPPEKKSKPRRIMVAAVTTALAALVLTCWVLFRRPRVRPANA